MCDGYCDHGNFMGKCCIPFPKQELAALLAKVKELEEENKALHGEGLTIYAFMGNEANKELKQRYAELVKACEKITGLSMADFETICLGPVVVGRITATKTWGGFMFDYNKFCQALQNIKEDGG